jgi:hypothetical protein
MQSDIPTTRNVLSLKPEGALEIALEYVTRDSRGTQTQQQNKAGTWSVRNGGLEFQYAATPVVRYRPDFSGKDRLILVREGVANGAKVIYDRVKGAATTPSASSGI